LNQDNEPIDSFTIWDSYWDIGTPNQHMQQIVLNYEIQLTKFLCLVLSKQTILIRRLQLARASTALSQIEIDNTSYNLGNTIRMRVPII
jgi:hypothetical protein